MRGYRTPNSVAQLNSGTILCIAYTLFCIKIAETNVIEVQLARNKLFECTLCWEIYNLQKASLKKTTEQIRFRCLFIWL